MNGEGSYFLVKFCRLDDSGVKVLEDMLGERVECRLKIDWGGFSSRVMLYEANREDSSITLILFGLSDRMRHCSEAKLLEAVSESLGGLFELEVSKISAEALASERPDVEKNIFPSLAMRGMRYGRLDAALTLKSGERLMEEAAAVCGWGGFCAALKRIARRMDNDASGKANLNVAFVVESDNPAGDYVRVLYDFYFSRGVISSPFICRGDMDDAASSSDGGFMYVVKDCGIDDDDVVFMGRRGVESCLRRLRSRRCVYAALLAKEEYEALASNPLFECVFPTVVRIAEPSAEEKLAFIRKEAAGYNFELAGDVTKETLDGVDFNNMLAKLVKAVSSRLEEEECSYTLSAADFAVEEKAREERPPFEELDAFIGLDGVKRTVREIAAFVERRGKEAGLCLHMVFRGRPGTGKTTVARIIGKIFGAAGVIKNADKFIEADRAALVSKYLGGTAPRVRDVVTAALGGVLFIDEAYSLCEDGGRGYGHEAVATLVKLMEDHRKEFVCILAGYPDEMDEMLDMNPGMRGRVQFYIDFPDYSAAEMLEIFDSMCRAEGYAASEEARAVLEEFFEKLTREEDFANGRTVRRVFEQIRIKQAVRSERMDIEEEDVRAVMEAMPLRGASHRARAIGFLDVA